MKSVRTLVELTTGVVFPGSDQMFPLEFLEATRQEKELPGDCSALSTNSYLVKMNQSVNQSIIHSGCQETIFNVRNNLQLLQLL